MKIRFNVIMAVVAACLLFTWAVAPALATEGTITGKVTEDYQIVTSSGDRYDVVESEKSEELMDHVGKTVKATGTLSEEDGTKSITVVDFTVME